MKSLSKSLETIFAACDSSAVEEFIFLQSGESVVVAWGARQPIKPKGNNHQARFIFPGFHTHFSSAESGPHWKEFPQASFFLENSEFFLFDYPAEDSFHRELPLGLGLSLDAWIKYCKNIESSFAKGELEKIVPARYEEFNEDQLANSKPSKNLQLLLKNYAGLHRFFWRRGRDFFWGASPELLFSWQNTTLFVPAIAGTRRRGSDPIEDLQLERELRENLKEQKEHAVVVDFLRKNLAQLGSLPLESPPEILKLKSLQHLYTPIRMRLEAAPSVEKLLQALHPTPALGGSPQQEARNFLRKSEPWERGHFTAPLYVEGPEHSFAIAAIRCALKEGNKVYLFAGAGYVPGSTPEAEWQETAWKMRAMSPFMVDRGHDEAAGKSS